MADYGNRREITKRKLRENVIDRNAKVEVLERRPVSAVLILILIAVGLIGVFAIYRDKTYTAKTASTVWEKDLGESSAAVSFRGYSPFAGGVIMYTKDGAEYIDRTGISVWQKSYQMNNPRISVREGYAVVYDQGGTCGCVFSESENTGSISTVLPVSKLAVSGIGVSYAVENDSNADFLMAYRKDGSAIDLTVKSVIDGDGYPFDISPSTDGSQLLTSYIAITEGSVKESIVFRNFGEVGQNADARRVVGGFIDEFEGHVVTKVGFADNVYSHAFYDGGIVFFSTKVLNSPEILKKVEIEEEIRSVADCSAGVAVVTGAPGETERQRLRIFDNNGNETGSADFDLTYVGFEANEETVILYSSDRILAYSHTGRLLVDLTWDGKLTSVVGTKKPRELIVAESGKILYVRAE